jgi:hypothetical protein
MELSYVAMLIHFEFDPKLDKAEYHCGRALALDPALPEGQLARSFILWSPAKNFQHGESIQALEKFSERSRIMNGLTTGSAPLACTAGDSKKPSPPNGVRGGRIRRPGATISSSCIFTAAILGERKQG